MSQARQVWFSAIVFVWIGLMGSAAQAGSLPLPVCGRSEVLSVVADDIARRGVAAVILPGAVGEAPDFVPGTVRCAVRLQTTFYDTDRYGYVPQVRLSILEFTVRAGRNGLFVDTISIGR